MHVVLLVFMQTNHVFSDIDIQEVQWKIRPISLLHISLSVRCHHLSNNLNSWKKPRLTLLNTYSLANNLYFGII